jgi:hypothetical protein
MSEQIVQDNGAAAAAEAIETITNDGQSNESAGVDQLNDQNLDPNFSIGESTGTEGVQAETMDELKEEIQEAVEDGATEQEVKNMIREYEIKVNGKKKKVKVDLNNEQDLIRRLQLAEAGQGAMQEKAELEKFIAKEVMRWKDNPKDFFAETGLDAQEWAERMITEKVEELQKSPEELERERLLRELEDTRKKLQVEQQEKQEARMMQLQQQATAQLENELLDAFEKYPNLPKTKKTVGRITDALDWAVSNGYPDATVMDVMPAVEEEIRSEISDLMSELPVEMMEAWIGKQNMDRMRKQRLAKVQKAPKTTDVKPITKEEPKKNSKDESPFKKSGTKRSKDYFRNLS